MNKHHRWLESEMERWVGVGIISREQATAIRGLYAAPANQAPWGLIVFFGIGAVVLGLGVILLLAYNWDELSKAVKLGLVLGGVALAHAAGVMQAKAGGWRVRLGEALSLLGTMLFGAGIWLVAQIYHIEEHFPNGFLFWALGALAMAWALQSVSQGVLATVLLAIWGLSETLGFDWRVDGALALLLAGVGPLAWRRRSALLASVLLPSLYLLLIANAAHWAGGAAAFAAAFSLSAVLLALGKWAEGRAEIRGLRRVLRFFGIAGWLVCSYIGGFHGAVDELLRWSGEPHDGGWAGVIYHGAWFAAALILWAWVALKVRRGELGAVRTEEWLCPIALVYAELAAFAGEGLDARLVSIVFNLVMLCVASAWMVRGCREQRLRPVVLGSVLLSLVVFARYFDLFESLAVRGMVFIGLGAVLFAEGVFYRRARSATGRDDA